jgi:hypothetical protein
LNRSGVRIERVETELLLANVPDGRGAARQSVMEPLY